MIESVLIANRGEIARRVIRTCREMGIRTVAVYSDADRDLPFAREADLALRLGAPPAAESYLDVAKLVGLAQGNAVDAIHPGYGFLAENPAFSEACAQAGLAFIGPSAEVIRAMGDKAEAKRRMEAAGVPIVPGYMGDDADEATLLREAERVGFPVLLKAVAGGGGRGIRLVTEAERFPAELESARREARNAFGDDRVMTEKYLERPRHVEFQVLADAHGTVLHLFERECSVQRRHQKVVEETPSPALTPALRVEMAEAAVRATQAIGYVGAGTIEFMLDAHGRFYFLEMNTRLQVEHPITELTLGVDLVRLQIEVAEGRPLSLRQEDLVPRGHAIECRLNAEDPARGFLPSVGPLRAFEFPAGEGRRVDAGFAAGTAVSPHYDSLLAKLIAWGPSREEALRRMARLLAAGRVAGIASNLPFLQGVIAHPVFRSGDYSTRFLDEHGAALADPELPAPLERERLLAAAAIDAWLERQRQARHPRFDRAGEPNPWRQTDEPARLEALPALLNRRYGFGKTTQDVALEVRPGAGRALEITAAWVGTTHRFAYLPGSANGDESGGEGWLDLAELRLPLRWDAAGNQRWFTLRGLHLRCTADDPALLAVRGASAAEASERLRAPLPGKVIKVGVQAGETVKPDQPLLVLEAMKVEHTITAPFGGKVTRVCFAEGEQVNRDDQLIELEATEG
ncbi:MAG TPA: biotin carboxylase N-terminal domain-containing protein [bacterium]|nr:biotin carboxylase N-terminal domain-containing protein [bacterium]